MVIIVKLLLDCQFWLSQFANQFIAFPFICCWVLVCGLM